MAAAMARLVRGPLMADDRITIDPAVDVIRRNGGVRFVTTDGGFAMRDPAGLVADIAAKCSAGASTGDIIASYLTPAEREAATYLTDLLTNRRILTPDLERHHTAGDPAGDWVRHYASAPAAQLPPVQVHGNGVLAESLRRRLISVGNSSDENAAACVVAAFDAPCLNSLRQLNLDARNTNTVFLPVWLERSTVRWGPMTLPCATGCLECLLHREHSNRRRADPVETMDMPELTASPMLAEMAAGFAIGEILRWAFDAHVDTDLGVAWQFDFLKMSLSGGRVMRLPRCPVCGMGGEVRP